MLPTTATVLVNHHHNRFLELALHELRVSAANVCTYAALLDAQLPPEPSPVRDALHEIRVRAAMVETLVIDLAVRDSPAPR